MTTTGLWAQILVTLPLPVARLNGRFKLETDTRMVNVLEFCTIVEVMVEWTLSLSFHEGQL